MVTEVARDAKIPVYGSSAVMVDSGAFATIAISDTEIGAQTADMALEYLNGTAMEDIAAVVVPASNMVINQDTDVYKRQIVRCGAVPFIGSWNTRPIWRALRCSDRKVMS